MDLTHEEVEKYLEQICSKLKIVDIMDKSVLFKYPSVYNMIKARRIYDREYTDSLNDGLISVDAMRKIIKERKIISDEDQRKLNSFKSSLEAQRILLSKTTKVKANQDRIKKAIHELEYNIKAIEYKERSKFSMTAETKAEEAKLLYLCWSHCYNFDTDELYWTTYSDFTVESDLKFRERLVSEFILFYSGISTTHIRSIARNNLWRIRYVTSLKTSEPLFGVPTSEYSNDMLNLVYWSHYYQNIYEMMPEDQPNEDIIEDDEALDAYLSDYYKERTQDIASRKSKRSMGGSRLSAFDQEEVIVTRSNELYEDIEYDKPREAQAIKDRNFIRKRTRRGR
jgi:hypothetical protein